MDLSWAPGVFNPFGVLFSSSVLAIGLEKDELRSKLCSKLTLEVLERPSEHDWYVSNLDRFFDPVEFIAFSIDFDANALSASNAKETASILFSSRMKPKKFDRSKAKRTKDLEFAP